MTIEQMGQNLLIPWEFLCPGLQKLKTKNGPSALVFAAGSNNTVLSTVNPQYPAAYSAALNSTSQWW